ASPGSVPREACGSIPREHVEPGHDEGVFAEGKWHVERNTPDKPGLDILGNILITPSHFRCQPSRRVSVRNCRCELSEIQKLESANSCLKLSDFSLRYRIRWNTFNVLQACYVSSNVKTRRSVSHYDRE
ncbi:hypothetical protein HN011_009568, partial [Eciton burchellii]